MSMASPQWGGRRTPRNPAPVSGPGQLSRRTDGGPQQAPARMSGMDYGDNQALEEVQGSAPMSASPSAKSPRARSREAAQMPSATPLFAETQRPDEPVTAGAPFGPGADPSMQPNLTEQAIADAAIIGKYLPDLMSIADQSDTPDGFKRFVRYLRNIQGA
jgi:hypothetical protein